MAMSATNSCKDTLTYISLLLVLLSLVGVVAYFQPWAGLLLLTGIPLLGWLGLLLKQA